MDGDDLVYCSMNRILPTRLHPKEIKVFNDKRESKMSWRKSKLMLTKKRSGFCSRNMVEVRRLDQIDDSIENVYDKANSDSIACIELLIKMLKRLLKRINLRHNLIKGGQRIKKCFARI